MDNPNKPDIVVSKTDKGDDIQRRFRYQCTYAAILSLYMFETDSIIEEVYCEMHEDILLKLKSGKFCGIQVKTRENHLGPFNLDDSEIKKSIIRFIQHESKFEDKFEYYTIATNAGFSKDKNKCINSLIELARKDDITELLKPRSKSKAWIQGIAKDANCNEKKVIKVLSRLRLYGAISSIDDIQFKLTQKLAELLQLGNETLGSLKILSDNLILMHIKASSLANQSILSEYFILCKDPEEEELKAIISGKKVTRKSIEDIILKFQAEPITLIIKDSTGIPEITGVKKLEKKMDAGGISYDNIQLAKDQKYSSESLAASWIHKFDQNEAEKRYDQVKLIINNECQEAFDESLKPTELFGTEMLISVRKRLKDRYFREKESFFDCKYDHLLGVAAILTEECKVWWSQKFDIK